MSEIEPVVNDLVKMTEMCFEKDQEIERLNNIIKEVRKYANTDKNCVPKHITDYINNLLDKGE